MIFEGSFVRGSRLGRRTYLVPVGVVLEPSMFEFYRLVESGTPKLTDTPLSDGPVVQETGQDSFFYLNMR